MPPERPRIGLVGPLPPPMGGMANQTRQLADLLRAEGLEIEVVRTNAAYRPAWIGSLRGVRALFRLARYVVQLFRLCGRVDVCHVMANSGWSWHLFAAPAIWIARLRRVPVIVNYRGGDAERFLRSAPWWVRSTLRAAQACIVPTEFLRVVLDRFGIPTAIIPNIIDGTLFKPSDSRRRAQGIHVIVTRNLEAIYGIDDALRAFRLIAADHEDARLTIAGDGPERSRLQVLAAQLGIDTRVRFTGGLAREAMAELYRDADIMLNPSTIDNMPNSVLEAYASGVAVVSTDVGGIPYIARDGETALLVPPHQPDVMAHRIGQLIGDRALRERLIRNGLGEARRYGWAEVRDQWIGLYAELCSPNSLPMAT